MNRGQITKPVQPMRLTVDDGLAFIERIAKCLALARAFLREANHNQGCFAHLERNLLLGDSWITSVRNALTRGTLEGVRRSVKRLLEPSGSASLVLTRNHG